MSSPNNSGDLDDDHIALLLATEGGISTPQSDRDGFSPQAKRGCCRPSPPLREEPSGSCSVECPSTHIVATTTSHEGGERERILLAEQPYQSDCQQIRLLRGAQAVPRAIHSHSEMKTVLVTGSNRGMGLEFVKQYLVRGARVIATCRRPAKAEALTKLMSTGELEGRLSVLELDTTDDDSVAKLSSSLGDECSIDVLVLNAGIKGDGSGTAEDFQRVYQTNAVAPLLLCRALRSHVARSKQKQIVAMSSGVGSIAENESGGMEAYRMSKAALNMAMVGFAVSTGREEGIHVLSMVPGWVRTDMGGPRGRLSPEEAVGAMIDNVIEAKDKYRSGGLYDNSGKEWPF